MLHLNTFLKIHAYQPSLRERGREKNSYLYPTISSRHLSREIRFEVKAEGRPKVKRMLCNRKTI